MKFTPDIKFVNDEKLNEFVVTVERRNVGETDAKNDRYSDREDRDKRDEEDREGRAHWCTASGMGFCCSLYKNKTTRTFEHR